MDNLIHPVSGEKGFFITTLEKKVIDSILESRTDVNSSLIKKGEDVFE